MKKCTTHHLACDCREQKFKELEAENAALQERLEQIVKQTNGQGWKDFFDMKALQIENAGLRDELNAQAVVNGKGSEREAKLLAACEKFCQKLDKLEAENALLLESTNGFCRHIQTLADLLTPEQKLKALQAIEAGRRRKP